MNKFFLAFLCCSLILVRSDVCPSSSSRIISYYIASDLEDWVRGPSTPNGGKAVAAVGNSGWSANIPGAIWIWDSEPVSNPAIDQTVYYVKEFFVPGVPLSATFTVNGDNQIWTYLNGASFGCDNLNGSWWSGSEKTCNALSYVKYGLNVLNITVTNIGNAGQVSGTGVNPAGALYKLSLTVRIDN